MSKSLVLGTVLMALAASSPLHLIDGKVMSATPITPEHPYFVSGGDSLLASNELSPIRSTVATITGYSSTPDQTDDTPFVTASGKNVGTTYVAANWLPFGTRIRIPEIFGDKVFEVQDRMHPKNNDKLDIWFQTREEALKFGVKKSRIEIL